MPSDDSQANPQWVQWRHFDRIGRCARCGHDHHGITAYKFRHLPEETDYVAFAPCPTTGEPILFSMIEVEEDHDP